MILEIAWQIGLGMAWSCLGVPQRRPRRPQLSARSGVPPLPLYQSPLLRVRSPSVGFLQPPGSEQYQMPQSPSPCSPPQMPQQYSGKSVKAGGARGAAEGPGPQGKDPGRRGRGAAEGPGPQGKDPGRRSPGRCGRTRAAGVRGTAGGPGPQGKDPGRRAGSGREGSGLGPVPSCDFIRRNGPSPGWLAFSRGVGTDPLER